MLDVKIEEGPNILDDIIDRIGGNLKTGKLNIVTVGVHGFEDSEVIEYALANEFGTRKIPSRPFIRQTYDKFEKEIREEGFKLYQAYIEGEIDREQALFAWGQFFVNLIQNEINEGNNFVENKPATLKAKGGNKNPLQDSGRLQQSIKSVVE